MGNTWVLRKAILLKGHGQGKGSSPVVEFNRIGAGSFILKDKIVNKLFFEKFLTNLPFI
jgi:hypothetical protein